LHLEIIAATREEFPEILATEIPYWSDIERMSQRRAPLCAYAPHSPAGAIYAALWQEIQSRMAETAVPVAAENELPAPSATVVLNSPLIPTPVEPS
jgi:hypothetical protein